MLIKKFFLFVVGLVFFLTGAMFFACAPGFQSNPVSMNDLLSEPDESDEDLVPPPPPAPGTTTTTTRLLPSPTTTTLPRPPGGSIACPSYGGRFGSAEQIIKHAQQIEDASCIKLNDKVIREGFGPCVVCTQDGWMPPAPSPVPPGPTPTTTRPPTPSTGWPTTTTRPGSAF